MEQVIFLIEVDDVSAFRAKKQKDLSVQDDLYFKTPSEMVEYDPRKEVPLFDDSLFTSPLIDDKFKFYYLEGKQKFQDALAFIFEQGYYLSIYYIGLSTKDRFESWIDEYCQTKKSQVDVYSNRSFDSEFDQIEEIIGIQNVLQKTIDILNKVPKRKEYRENRAP